MFPPPRASAPSRVWRFEFADEAGKTFDLAFATEHYVIYPWILGGRDLLRVLTTRSGLPFLARIYREHGARPLKVEIRSPHELVEDELGFAQADLAFCLGLDANYRLVRAAARSDAILSAALQFNKGIRPKRYSSVFEATCGAICAQNVDFRRLYGMMELLCQNFGSHFEVDGASYWGFPVPEAIAGASDEKLRHCKVGYRAARLRKAAEWFSTKGMRLDRDKLRNAPLEEAAGILCEVPGLGPYSAVIVLNAGAGRQDSFQLDSFTRHILQSLYCTEKLNTDEDMRAFIARRWNGIGGSVAHILTTNTHLWAAKLGYKDFRRSRANISAQGK
jgi:3-methyladenine DNA glycosylase/8-oxoguanine DNA glycosylase